MNFKNQKVSFMGPRSLAIIGLILLAAATRLVPHPPNFTPIVAMALFGGAYLSNRLLAFAVPLGALLFSDIILGFYSNALVVYGCFGFIVFIGLWLHKRKNLLPIIGATLVSSTIFFVITNFGVWAFGTMYPKTLSGLLLCYTAAIPFFGNSISGDVFYTALIFGGFAVVQKYTGSLQERSLSQLT